MSEFTQSCNIITSSTLLHHSPPLPTTARGVGSCINVNPKNPNEIIYPSGRFVVVRDISTNVAWVYRGHNTDVTCCKFSTNGNYVASADNTGKLRVWASNTDTKGSKLEIQVLGGPVSDLAWDGESKKIAVCGDGGSGAHVRCITWDTGNNAGEFVGHNKRATTVDYKLQRPYRIMSGSEDFKTVYYTGPPFKRDSESQTHGNYVNCVRFSPDGSRIVSVGSDKKLVVYSGSTGAHEKTVEGLHSGSIYSVSWFPCGTKVLTTSADKTAKVVGVPEGETLGTYTLGDKLNSFVVGGCVVSSGSPAVITLDGNIHVLSPSSYASPPTKTLNGHQGGIKDMALDSNTGDIYTGGTDGRVVKWSVPGSPGPRIATTSEGGKNVDINKAVHGGTVTTVDVAGEIVVSAGWDDVARFTETGNMNTDGVAGIGGQPKASGSDSGRVVIATKDTLQVIEGGKIKFSIPVSYSASSIAVKGDVVAVGSDKNKIHIYSLSSSGSLSETNVIEGHTGVVNSLAFNGDGSKLAAGDVKEVRVWNANEWTPEIKGRWQFHTSRITGVSWSPCGGYIASVGTDENMFVWSLEKKMRRLNYKFCHKGGCTGVEWTGEGRIVTCGEDGCVAEWDVGAEMAEKFK